MVRYRHHAVGIFRRGGRSHGFLPHPPRGGPPVAARLRHDPGRPRRTRTKPAAVPVRRRHHRRRGAEPRPHRSLRAAAAAREARVPRAYLHQHRVRRPRAHPAARFGQPRDARRGTGSASRGAGPHRAALRSRRRRSHAASAQAHSLRHASASCCRASPCACATPGTSSGRRASSCGRAKAKSGASSCSPAISGSTTRRSCTTRGSSSPPTWCSWKARTAIAVHRGREDTERELGGILAQAARDGGNVIVPAFAIGRSQELLYLLAKHYAEWHLARWKIFLDSPMAIAASRVYWNHPDRFDEEATRLRARFPRHAAAAESRAVGNAPTNRAPSTRCVAARIIIAGSGMANGGRVLHHLKHNLERPECHVVIVGFQAPGTLGRQLVDRQPEVRIHGQRVRCEAQIHTLGGLSAHGDQADLLRWYDSFAGTPAGLSRARRSALGRGAGGKAARARCNRDGHSSWLESRSCRLESDSPRLIQCLECPRLTTAD